MTQLFAETAGQSSVVAKVHPDAEIHSLEVTGRDSVNFRIAAHGDWYSVQTSSRQRPVIWPTLLYVSWITFGMCVVVTIFSFRLSVSALRKQLVFIEEYYLNGKKEYRDRESSYSKALKVFTWAAAILFLVGLSCTVVFCIENFKQEVTMTAPESMPRRHQQFLDGPQAEHYVRALLTSLRGR